ncbi:uncharacterized protein KGF55_004043 [Candida pseudojiufengensis]|uniref:uncharacterized protein n=1 Tax=Candida pseudojiufengensis TaxID=497109 RepID=UPI002224A5DA|nr:uncharacterized protein KGF55_004043 [Candida pseudojiufengensis]KAI5961420.1 hypothetical protein KGF55_004043 [Candida pseudojiufengensis]
MYFGESSFQKRIQELKDSIDLEKNVETLVPYPEPIKSKFPYKQQQLLPFDLKDNKLMDSSSLPKTNKEKLENFLKKYSIDYRIRVKYFFTKAWKLIKESFLIISYDILGILFNILGILFNILKILSTIIVFLFYTLRGLFYFTIEVLVLLACCLICAAIILLPIALLGGITFGIPFGLIYS